MRLSPTRNQKVIRAHQNIVARKFKLLNLCLVKQKKLSKERERKFIETFAVNPVEALQEFWQMKVVSIVIIVINITPHPPLTGNVRP